MELPGGRELLRSLFHTAGPGQQVELRPVPGAPRLMDPKDLELPEANELGHGTWYFGVLPRAKGGVIDRATCVWADFDSGDPPTPAVPPTATVLSGRPGGLHAYWALAEETEAARATNMARLAAIAWGGDRAVCESKRVMRFPGSYNYKYDPPRLCAIASLDPKVAYQPDDLEERLVGAVLARYWDGGSRHLLALGAGATLARAGWSRERVEAAVRWTCQFTDDTELADRIAAAGGTVDRKESGTLVSARDLREAMESDFREFLRALGITARDGEIISGGERVGHVSTLERDLVNLILEEGDWAYGDGGILRWNETYWEVVNPEQFTAAVFQRISGLSVVANGDEQEYNVTSKLAKAVAGVAIGMMMASPLPEPRSDELPLLTGILNVTTREIMGHDRGAFHRWVIPVEYDPGADCPAWKQFLEFAVKSDELLLLQEWLGYLLTPGNPWQRMLWLYGPTNTGKSTYLHAITELLGPAVAAISSGQLSDYSVAELAGKRVAVCSELPSSVLRTTTLKALVASDPVQARRPYGRPFPMIFTGKIVWASNALPPVDQGEGVWRRIVLMPFMNRPQTPDLLLKEKITAELAGVLNWALEGRDRVTTYMANRNWAHPQAVQALLEEYRQGADQWEQFGQDCLVLDPEALTPITEIYQVYHAWAQERGFKPEPLGPIFRQALKHFGGEPSATGKRVGKKMVRAWRGVRIQEDSFIGGSDDE